MVGRGSKACGEAVPAQDFSSSLLPSPFPSFSLSLWGYGISIPQTGPGPGFQGTRAAHSTVSSAANRLISDVASLTGVTELCLLSVPWCARKFSPDASVCPQLTMSPPVRPKPPILRRHSSVAFRAQWQDVSLCPPQHSRVIKSTAWTPAT